MCFPISQYAYGTYNTVHTVYTVCTVHTVYTVTTCNTQKSLAAWPLSFDRVFEFADGV